MRIVPIVLAVLACLAFVPNGIAQMPGMSAMENSAGTISSGTSIEPAAVSEASTMIHGSLGSWTVMFHANAFVLDIQQSGPRGGDKFLSTNWMMPMLTNQWGPHSVTLRTMLSLEPATVTKRRYPLLFQTGETAFGLPIVDGQHPHNLFMEIAGRYDFDVNDKTRLFFYGGPIGEPALGPTPFPHRSSASENPVAMLGHHMQDSTHLSYSVITAGISAGPVQLEASTFHGQEPNENRWYIGTGKPDSYSARLSVAPTREVAGQFSIGRINHREPHEPGLDTLRMTASIHHNLTLASGSLASSVIWGRNNDMIDSEERIFNAYALESTLNFKNRNWVWTRIENLDKDRTLLFGETPEALDVEETPIGRVQAYSFGYERDILRTQVWANVGLGFQFTTYGLTDEMKTVYGNSPKSFVVFLHLRPVGNMAAHMRAMHGHFYKYRMARSRFKYVVLIILLAIVAVSVWGWLVLSRGLSARDEPGFTETFVARRLRRLSIPGDARNAKNPVKATPEVLSGAMEHFADHCATCHANDGTGNTGIGRGLYPKAPDMTQSETQGLTDGELYYIIENGIRFTGMPAFGEASAGMGSDESWALVAFIRHLPQITLDEIAAMKKMNPKSPAQLEKEERIRKFLEGDDGAATEPGHQHQH